MARSLLPHSANPPDDSQSNQDEAESDKGESERIASQVRAMNSESDDDSGNSFSSPSASAFVVKQNPNSKKKKKRDVTDGAETYESEVKKKKKMKKNGIGAIAAVEEKAKKSTGRLWSPEDELIILEKMLDYKQETGVDASSNLKAFHSYIKDSLNAIADKSQLSSKIKKLREKYHANARKEANGEELFPSFKGHEAKAYEHSKKIWGHKVIARGSQFSKIKPKPVNVVVPCSSVAETDSVLALPVPEREMSSKEVNCGSAKVSSQVPKVAGKVDLDDADNKNKDSSIGDAKISSQVPKVARKMDLEDPDHEKKDSNISMPVLLDSFVLKKGLDLVERSKLDALNEKWTKYQLDAAELYLRRLELVREQTRLILNAQKSNP